MYQKQKGRTMMNQHKDPLIFRLIFAVVLGFFLGNFATTSLMSFILIAKDILGQLIFFTIPLIILGFIAPSVAKLQENASKLLGFALILAYVSTIGAAFFSMASAYLLLPYFQISPLAQELSPLPALIFQLDISPVMPVMSALVLALMLGLTVSATKSKVFFGLLEEFQQIALRLVQQLVIPLLPFFIGCTFAVFAYEGAVTKQIPIFFAVILLAILGQILWLIFLYTVAGIYCKTNPKEVYRHYLPAYCTALGTMSSAATLPVSLRCAQKSKILSSHHIDFAVPLFSNIHLCGSVLTEVFFVMVVSQLLYSTLPSLGTMVIFLLLLGLFGIGAPGVPGGTVMASLGLITGVLGFDAEGTALMMTIFALQDSFGTACNVTGDGALTMIFNHYSNTIAKKRQC